jgi:hypothetical protein
MVTKAMKHTLMSKTTTCVGGGGSAGGRREAFVRRSIRGETGHEARGRVGRGAKIEIDRRSIAGEDAPE